MEFEEDAKWQHFAFAADSARVDALRRATVELFETGAVRALVAFHEDNAQRFAEEEARVRVSVPPDTLRDVLARARKAYEPRRGALATAVPIGPVPRLAWEAAVARTERLERLVELDAPQIIVDNELDLLADSVTRLVAPRPAVPVSYRELVDAQPDELHGLFADCVSCCLPPFPENIGVAGAYELFSPVARMVYGDGADPFVCDDLMPRARLVPADIAVLHTVADALPAGLLIGDSGPVAWASGEALRAFANELRVPELVGRDTLEKSSDEPNDENHFRFVAGVDEEDLRANERPLRERIERYRAACFTMLARGETLLTWIAKNPAL